MQIESPTFMTRNSNSVNINDYPSVVQTHRHPTKTSGRYSFLPTTHLLEALDKQGWFVTQVQEAKANLTNQGFQKHLVRLQHKDLPAPKVGGVVPELVVGNSHNSASSFFLMFGMFRLICTNGMIVSMGDFGQIRIRHFGYSEDDVFDASFRVIEKAPEIVGKVDRMNEVITTPTDQIALTRVASLLRFGDPDANVFGINDCRRSDDFGDNLFTVFNRIQENMMKGGLRMIASNNARRATNEITNIDRNISINTGLWDATSELLKIKEGGRIRTQWAKEQIGSPSHELHNYLAAA